MLEWIMTLAGWQFLLLVICLACFFTAVCSMVYTLFFGDNEAVMKLDVVSEADLKARRAFKKYTKRKKP